MLGYLVMAVGAVFATLGWFLPPLYEVANGFLYAGVILVITALREKPYVALGITFIATSTIFLITHNFAVYAIGYLAFFGGATALLAWREKSTLLATSAALYVATLLTLLTPLFIPASLLAWYATRHITY